MPRFHSPQAALVSQTSSLLSKTAKLDRELVYLLKKPKPKKLKTTKTPETITISGTDTTVNVTNTTNASAAQAEHKTVPPVDVPGEDEPVEDEPATPATEDEEGIEFSPTPKQEPRGTHVNDL